MQNSSTYFNNKVRFYSIVSVLFFRTTTTDFLKKLLIGIYLCVVIDTTDICSLSSKIQKSCRQNEKKWEFSLQRVKNN